ncbi:MAG: diphthine synthase [Thermoproteota archaeon]
MEVLGEIVFVGLGLHDERGISLRGLEEIKRADTVFVEFYTSLMVGFSMKKFEEICGKKFHVVSRRNLEEEDGETVLRSGEEGETVLLVPGDPLIATTHVALRIEAEKRGIKTSVVHGASVLSAVIGLSGLHNYKFGKSVTIPFSEVSETAYEVIGQNSRLGLHTLCLLDVKVEDNRYMEIREGLQLLLKIEERRKQGITTGDTLAVGIAKAGSRDPTVKAGYLKNLLDYRFGGPPHTIIFPGKLHFMEVEALTVLAEAPEKMRETVR